MSRNFRNNFMKHWFVVEAIPIWCIVGIVVTGGSFFAFRSAMGPTIQWTKVNATPWNDIRPNQSTKLIQVDQKFDEQWRREKL
ncbi:hypothetical protein BDP27DRAFT_1414483 [Rhodocollybia butyracea]|uniref:Uncharacterized protein n=1 Tax=Rhodocollybia butyracea TaxID=206335 RepID=A0A9P5QA86_9AGAR|nr:hypothetical protein BDP27DRAFT_1414483 [Rhodocollybia butyracea]